MKTRPTLRRRALVGAMAAGLALALAGCGGSDDEGGGAARADANYALKDGAYVLDAATATLVAQDADSLTVEGAGAAAIQPGNVIVSTLGNGALVRVREVQELGGGRRRFVVEPAAIIDAFDRFNLQFDRALDSNDLGSQFDTGDPGLQLSWAPTAVRQSATGGASPLVTANGPSLTLSLRQWDLSAARGIELTGDANFSLQPDFHVELVPVAGSSIPALTYRAALAPAYSHVYTLSSQYGGSLGGSKRKEIALRPIVLASPPVTIVPYVVVEASIAGTAAGKFSVTHTASISGSAFVERRADGSGDAGHSFQPLMNGRFESVESSVGIDVTPARLRLDFRLYNVGGPQFQISANGHGTGAYERDGLTGAEGIRAKLTGDLSLTASVGGSLDFLKVLYKDLGGEFTLFGKDFTLADGTLFDGFFPFTGSASIRVFDSGSVADDIFEVSVDDVVLGRTAKGGSGQFRIGSLRPGSHTLKLVTVEDDSPPGTWTVQLSNGVSFADGSTARSGGLALGAATALPIVVPAPAP